MNEMPNPCVKEIPICLYREAHLYWNALNKAKELGKIAAAFLALFYCCHFGVNIEL